MAITFEQRTNEWCVLLDGRAVLTLPIPEGAHDSFEPIGENAFYWHRKTDTPVDHMRLTLKTCYVPTYFQVPAVNYNGNGWGSGAQYSGYTCKGEPWTYAWHRVAIPACTYTENENYAVALFGEEKGGMSCSVYPVGDQTVQELIWPEIETPKTLSKRCWKDPYYGTMEPTDSFTGIVMLMPVNRPRGRVRDLLDLAWTLNDREVKMPRTPERVLELDRLFFRLLYYKKSNGLIGFCHGVNWNDDGNNFLLRAKSFEIGWVGQNGAKSCALLEQYLETGDEDLKEKALSVMDSWDKYAFLPNGLMHIKLMEPPFRLDNEVNGDVHTDIDACNLGTAGTFFFRMADLCKKAGIDRPNYEKRAYGLCDFFVEAQQESGEFAKNYFMDGSIAAPHGSTGAFIVLPLMDAYERTGDRKYLDSALRGLNFYLDEFNKGGYTTAGALDSNCIDKESAAPMIRGALRAYEITGEQVYLDNAVELGYYLATWQLTYTVDFPDGALLRDMGIDTYGSTSVSAAHNVIDHYGLYWVPEYLKLAELTGNDIWRKRARALWYNGTQAISDGTLVVKGRVRPVGGQDESYRHTRWGRIDNRYFVPCEWLTAWQGTFRYVTLGMVKDWDVLR